MRKVVLFGTGKVYSVFMQLYDRNKLEIVGLSDNNKQKQGLMLDGVKIYDPNSVRDLAADWIVITTAYVEEVKAQLLELGIEENKIKNFYSIYKKLSPFEDENWINVLKEDYCIALTAQKNRQQEVQVKQLQQKSLFLEAKNFINSMPERINSLEEVEFQVFSQFGEDGIIQWLIRNAKIANKTFVEFGASDYVESNTRFLLMNNNWSGLIIDGSKDNIEKVKEWDSFWKYDLTAINEFITKDNINRIIMDAGFSGDLGILSLDIDGNDYWVLCAITCVKPCILICEYNNTYGDEKKVTIPYDENFFKTDKHYSNLYWGASLGAFKDYAEKNGYYYFGSNSAGHNAFFVRKDCIDSSLIPMQSSTFVVSKYRESIDLNGKFNFLSGNKKLEVLRDMDLVNLETGRIEKISNIYCL